MQGKTVEHPLEEQSVPVTGFAERFLHLPADRDIPRRCVDPSACGKRSPFDPTIVAVLATIAVDEIENLFLVSQRGDRIQRSLYILGMDELDEETSRQLIQAIPQGMLPFRIQPEETPLRVGDAEQIESAQEKLLRLLGLLLYGFEHFPRSVTSMKVV